MRYLLLPLVAITVTAQTPTFEVASVRPGKGTTNGMAVCGRVDVGSDTLLSPESFVDSNLYRLDGLIRDAYRDEVDDFDIPNWVPNNGLFAVGVKMPANTTARTCRKMLQALLAERFHLVVAVEMRDVTRYYLKVAKSGLKLKPVVGPPADLNASVKTEIRDSLARRSYRAAPMSRILNSLRVHTDMEAFALSFHLAGVNELVDETGLAGYYDGEFSLTLSIAARRDESAESLSDALARQLGLTLESRRSPGKVLVLVSSDRMPTEN